MAIPQTRPAIEIFGFHLVESQTQRRALEIEAQKARVYKPDNIMALDIVRALVWGQDPKPFEVRGEFALVNSDSQDLEMTQSSRVLSPDGFLFRTTDLFYKDSERLITSDQPVQADQVAKRHDSDLQLLGKGLTINLGRNTYEIRHNVRAEQKTAGQANEAKTLSIFANNLIIFPAEQSATFSHKVMVKATDFNLKGERLVVDFQKKDENAPLTLSKLMMDSPSPNSDDPEDGTKIQAQLKSMRITSYGLTIELDPVQGGMKKSEAIGEAQAETDDNIRMRSDTLISDSDGTRNRVLMKGNVTILTDNRKGTCQEATYYPDTGDIILEKVATISNDKEVLKGDRIRFSTKHSNIYVDRASGRMDKADLVKSPNNAAPAAPQTEAKPKSE